MSKDSKFPPINPGMCDGMGCGAGVCWCIEYNAMNYEYQRLYNKPLDTDSEECKVFEASWRFGTKRLMNMIDSLAERVKTDGLVLKTRYDVLWYIDKEQQKIMDKDNGKT